MFEMLGLSLLIHELMLSLFVGYGLYCHYLLKVIVNCKNSFALVGHNISKVLFFIIFTQELVSNYKLYNLTTFTKAHIHLNYPQLVLQTLKHDTMEDLETSH